MKLLIFIVIATFVLLPVAIYIETGKSTISYKISVRYFLLDRRCPFCHIKMKKKITKYMDYYKSKRSKSIIACYRLIPEFECPICSYKIKIIKSRVIRS